MAHHLLHVEQVARIGAQVVGNALFVTDVNHDMGKDARRGAVGHGYGQTALDHILQQSHTLQANRLAAGIGSGDDEDAALGRETDVERHHALALLGQRELEQRMLGTNPVDMRTSLHTGLHRPCLFSQTGLGPGQVDEPQETVGMEDVLYMGPQFGSKLREDAYHLASLLRLELPHPVVGLHYLGRLDKDSLARGRLVVYDAAYLLL